MNPLVASIVLMLVGGDVPQAQPVSGQEKSLPEPKAILDRYVQAIGGREAWLARRHARINGRFESVELGFSGPLEVFAAAPNKRFTRLRLENYGVVLQGFDGKRAWSVEPQQEMRFQDGRDLAATAEDSEFYAELNGPEKFRRVETTRLGEWDGRAAFELKFVSKSGREFSKFFDRETGLLLALKSSDATPMITTYSAYRDFDGLRIPTREVRSSGGLIRQATTLSSVTFEPFDPGVFDTRRHEPKLARGGFPTRRKNGTGSNDRIDRLTLDEMKAAGIPGLALAVVQNGKLLKAEGYGLADIETKKPVTPGTMFQLCSLTKPFTALGVVMLAQAGKINLDDPVSRHVPGVPTQADAITVRQLLSHTAGLPREPYGWNALPTYDESAVVAAAFKDPARSCPGAAWAYSNTGYYLLGILMNHAAGMPWHQWLATRVFEPMKLTGTLALEQAGGRENRARGYILGENGACEPGLPDRTPLITAGGLMSSVLDLAKWETALTSGEAPYRAAAEQMWTPARLNNGEPAGYGLGWFLNTYRGHPVQEHSGGNVEGLRTILARFPDARLTIIILCNWAKADVPALARRVADQYLEKPKAE